MPTVRLTACEMNAPLNQFDKSLTIEHYQALLGELRRALAERVEAERVLAADRAPDNELSPLQLERRLQALAGEFDQASAAVEEQRVAARQELENQHQAEVAELRAEYAHVTELADSRFDSEMARVEKKHSEDNWLLASILDDKSENSPKWQFEKLQTQLLQLRESLATQSSEVETLCSDAVALAESRRQRTYPRPEPNPSPKNREAAQQAIAAAAEVVRAQSASLARQIVPRLFARIGILFLTAAIVWGALFAGAFFALTPQMLGFKSLDRIEWVLLLGGAALAVDFVMVLIGRYVGLQQTAGALEPLLQGAVDSQAFYKSWLKFAKDELQRSEQAYLTRQAAIVERRDKSVEQFAATRNQRIRELEAERRHEFHAAAQAREAAIREAMSRVANEIAAVEAAHQREADALRLKYDHDRALLTSQHQQQFVARNAQRQELWNRAISGWSAAISMFQEECAALCEESLRLFPSWEEIAGPAWQPCGEIPPGVRLGDYEIALTGNAGGGQPAAGQPTENATYHLPAVLTFPNLPSLVLKVSGAGRDEAVSILQVAMLRLLTQIPPGNAQFTIIDPVGLGENFAAFMHLADYDELLISHRIWTESTQIEEQLAKLTEHMENVFQKYLRNEFESIEEYNQHAGEVAEPYRVLIVANFPAGFSERAAQRLISIATSGARCGVLTLLSVDLRQPLPHGFDLEHLAEESTVLDWDSTTETFINRALAGEPLALAADAPPAPPVFASLIRKMGDFSKNVRRVEVPFYRIVPREEHYWTADSRGQVEVPLGRAGATKLQYLRLGKGTSQHVLVAGKTGSGKSTLLHVIVTDLALRYSPDEVEFYLIDFKKGVEFKTYATRRLPHARVIAIESDREFGTSVLERLDAILKERGDLFRQQGVQDIASFRDARPDLRMPRILLIVDEFQEFFVEDDRYAQTAALLLDRLVRQGRAFGIHILLGSQTLGGAYSLARTTIGQMAVRIALQCSETDAHLILSEDNGAARLLTRPGEAIYNDANGLVEGNNPFQVAWLDDAQRDGFLDRIAALAAERDTRWPPAIVFEGNIPADPSRNGALFDLVDSATRARQTAPPSAAPVAWLGEAVAITGPTAVAFSRRSGANLLLVGQDPEAAGGIMATCLIALTAQVRSVEADAAPSLPRFHLFAGETPAANPRRWQAVLDVLPERVRVTGPDAAAAALAEIAAEVARRQQERLTAHPIFIIIDDLSRFRDLRKSDDDFGFGGFDRDKAATPGQLLAGVLRDGPAVGVHLLVWCDSYNNVERWFSRQVLREFEMRVAFQMSAADSSNLIDAPAAARLGANRALVYSDERGTTEKFRPYGPPSAEWLAWLKQQLPPPKAEDVEVADDIDQWVVM